MTQPSITSAGLLSGPDIAQRAGHDIGLIPVGAIEQHGPHMGLDTDTFLAAKFSEALAERIGGVVLPGFNYGYRSQPTSGGGELFPGTVSLRGATLSAIVSDIVYGWARHGLSRIALINGHFENTLFLVEGVNLALERGARTKVVVLNWWEQISPLQLDEIFDGAFPGWEAEHAGVVETSLVWHLDPERVRPHLISPSTASISAPPYTVLPEPPGMVDSSGVLRTAHGSSPELGRAMFEVAVTEMATALRKEFRGDDDA
ncbi:MULTISPECIES: creatininase [unclassified Mycolicibacterium]|uniref:creatininase n=1 Tax=unclassified Mycolicibacterium TaxID=2636767 RepID=UPI0012DEF9D7|nr:MULTISPECIES: creatininase [unclassified Mycolicibacterium]MUL82254.1 creatininase [Mycolicibacterium sp. CBMA 329]MUL88020.1 creatininase [Mycolicibacterium sp. CBMA 331]MUM02351.1 creatininase [Mycolicibacterium sp. CBMA 334]MUM29109.1 creatininase [Mycolicibacterium sp. CBMA 295]MUM38317.1 creatininase [Mycolicibacterium sp. CBMA 247]